MTTAPDYDPRDRTARRLHAAALAHTSPRTLARLREARRQAAAPPARARPLAAWLAGGAVAAVLGLAVVLPGLRVPASAPAPALASIPAEGTAVDAAFAAAAEADFGAPLQEDPGFYAWLGSPDATALAME